MSLFRSEDMTLCQMYLQAEAAYSCVSQLGELAIVQFKDLNAEVNIFQRQFVNEIRRCEEMERQLRYFERELKKAGMPVVENEHNPEAPAPRDMIDLEATFENLESDLRELNNSIEALERNYMELQELKYVLRDTDAFFQQASHDMELGHYGTGATADGEAGPSSRLHLGYVAGVIPMAKIHSFNRLLWFASRGNIFVRHVEIPEILRDPHTGDEVYKAVFMAVFQGEQLKGKVKKICEGFKATLYPCPESADERRTMATGVVTRMADLQTVLGKSHEQRERSLRTISANLANWNIKVIKLKAIYHTMNMFHTEGQNYIAECWLPYAELRTVQMVLDRASEVMGIQVSSLLHPVQTDMLPTYHRTNKFTRGFQAIIDAYGVATYKEVNPALFSIITFPFLFSVMFGDFGHGLLMLCFALGLIICERRLVKPAAESEMFGIIFAGRYMILLMSLFSVYAGLIYNDAFSKPLNIFGSSWKVVYSQEYMRANKDLMLDPNDTSVFYGRSPYPFGVDPVWQMSDNKITFTNSFKKKLSVILGVSQMLLGVLLSIINHTYFRQPLNIVCEFIPQILFLLSIFGYMCGLIIAKWCIYSNDPGYYNCSPNILIGFINMFLMKYDENDVCSNRTWFPGQKELQIALVLIAVICAVALLLSKPLVLLYRHRRQHGMTRLVEDSRTQPSIGPSEELLHGSTSPEEVDPDMSPQRRARAFTIPAPKPEHFDSGEVFIHQAIHTIEFCLGCVSHTASYLRLWALSLAHSQLSEVLWTMVMTTGFTLRFLPASVRFLSVFIVFAPFAVLTVVILLLMEGLSAFLHTLRLHWVEFNSKFYKGEGIAFEPFSFNEMLIKEF